MGNLFVFLVGGHRPSSFLISLSRAISTYLGSNAGRVGRGCSCGGQTKCRYRNGRFWFCSQLPSENQRWVRRYFIWRYITWLSIDDNEVYAKANVPELNVRIIMLLHEVFCYVHQSLVKKELIAWWKSSQCFPETKCGGTSGEKRGEGIEKAGDWRGAGKWSSIRENLPTN